MWYVDQSSELRPHMLSFFGTTLSTYCLREFCFFSEEDAVDLDSLDILKDSLQQYMDDEVNPRSPEQFLSMSLWWCVMRGDDDDDDDDGDVDDDDDDDPVLYASWVQ